ncbi:fructose-1,6-bisphosphatase/inositol monophosphatase family enzyme [Sinorhizobium kostiense]|uniref:Fructose-1,6-bisphosphatase/inositol monophosphatase family enzyme n=1 Tax=Sinorhizobium kostiense TaxID=76747 RepID=A0ABS4R841_9HYPH|nr:inositol monophosphatase [Sinorhizobium kostiense]MBP2238500.1 fructose-1,6-bisphosphatase/inositol monophosphatase family enzyme [Sinorhizobium kostiense]
MSHSVDVAALANLLQEAAVKEILPRFRNLQTGEVRMKTEAIDLVTEADEAAERLIEARIDAVAPGAVFIGEESVAADPGLIEKLADADLAIVVDPIDGTFNFAAGLPLFGVMASVVAKGETIAGIIYDPLGKDWVIAEKGSGAWMCRPNGSQEKLTVTASVPLENMVGGASTAFYEVDDRRIVMGNLAKVRIATSYRCAAHEYRTFAAGHLHFLMYRKLMPWDHLAGTLIAEEAGAFAARFDGSRYLPAHNNGGLLLATDRESWDALRREVFTV